MNKTKMPPHEEAAHKTKEQAAATACTDCSTKARRERAEKRDG
jgi:hypothetical protein